MKKKVLISLGVFAVLLVLSALVTSYIDSARVRNSVEPKCAIKIVSDGGNKATYWGLGYKVVRYPSVSPNEPYKNNRGVKYGGWFMKYEMPTEDNKFNMNLTKYEGDVLTSPPELNVVRGKKSITALRGTSTWTYHNEDGSAISVCSDSMHPLNAKEHMTPLNLIPTPVSSVDPRSAYLQWDVVPDKVSVGCWSEDCWEHPEYEQENVPVKILEIDCVGGEYTTNYIIELKDGNYIYEVIAEWNSFEKFNGTARYSFYTTKPDMEFEIIQCQF